MKQITPGTKQLHEQLLHFQFNQSPDVIVLLDAEGVILNLNRGLQAGQEVGNWLGRSILSLLPKRHRKLCADYLSRSLTMQNVVEFELPFQSGQWLRLRLVPWVQEGQVHYLMLVVTDLSEQHQADLAMNAARARAEQSEARLVEAQRATKVGSWETDLQSLAVIWSDETYHIFEVDERTFKASHASFLSFVHPDDKLMVDEAFKNSFHTTGYNQVEHRIVASDGKVKYVEERWKIVCDESGKPIKAVGTCQDISERKSFEFALHAQKQAAVENAFKLNLVAKSAGMGIWDWHVKTGALHWDARVYEIHGFAPDASGITYADWVALLHPDDKTAVLGQINQALIGEEALSYTCRLLRRDQSIVYIQVDGMAIREGAGKPSRMVGLVKDVTAEKQAEQAIRDNELKYRTLFETSDDAIVLYCNGQWVDCNRSAERLFRGTREQLLGQDETKFSPALQPDGTSSALRAREIIAQVLAGQAAFFEWVHLRVDGVPFFAEIRLNRLDLNERPCIQAIIRDISERKKAHEQLALASLIVNSTEDAILSMTPEGVITSWNKGAEKVLGYTAQEAMGRSAYQLFCPDAGEEEGMIADILAQGRGLDHYSTLRVHKDGRHLRVSLSVSPIFNEKGQLVGASQILRDVTEQKLLEEEKNRIMEDLIQRNRDLEQFSYIISHNLRAPVANIIGITDLMAAEGTAELPISGDLQLALGDSARALDVVIKDLNYILQTKKEVGEQRTFVDFEKVVAAIRLSIKQLLEQEKVVFELDFSAVRGIESINSYVYSIFYNLISNSVKFKRAGVAPRISIRSEVVPNGVLLVFADNGLGIDLQKKGTELFGLYKRFHLHTEGKGMGLFLVKTQVEALGGQVEVSSVVDEGTEFRLLFVNRA